MEVISGVALYAGNDQVVVRMASDTDCHDELRRRFFIRDDGGAAASRQVTVVLCPRMAFSAVEEFDFRLQLGFGGARSDRARIGRLEPVWWSEAIEQEVKRQLFEAFRARWRGSAYSMPNVVMNGLRAIPDEVVLEATGGPGFAGNVELPRVITIGEGVRLRAHGAVYLPTLQHVGRDCRIVAPDVVLPRATRLPDDIEIVHPTPGCTARISR